MAGSISYVRSTTKSFTHTYEKDGLPSSDGKTLLFTVKENEYDADPGDSNAILRKTIVMGGSDTIVTILPEDIPDSVEPGDYFFSIHIVENSGYIQPGSTGAFTLVADSTNRSS